ncbi:MAG: PspC domain-containing protein [Candidatus Dormibacter sp.]
MGDTVGGVLRRGPDRIIAGVCSGIAEYFHLDPTLVRVVFVILALAPPGVGIILYLVLWFLMEPAGQPGAPSRTPRDRFRMMADEMRHEFRRGWRPFQADPGPAPPASPADPVAPSSSPGPSTPSGGRWGGPGYRGRPGGLWFGIILIALGAYLLLANLGYLSGFRWDLLWPVILIALGMLVLFRRPR